MSWPASIIANEIGLMLRHQALIINGGIRLMCVGRLYLIKISYQHRAWHNEHAHAPFLHGRREEIGTAHPATAGRGDVCAHGSRMLRAA